MASWVSQGPIARAPALRGRRTVGEAAGSAAYPTGDAKGRASPLPAKT